jgi:hypothetical protein
MEKTCLARDSVGQGKGDSHFHNITRRWMGLACERSPRFDLGHSRCDPVSSGIGSSFCGYLSTTSPEQMIRHQ